MDKSLKFINKPIDNHALDSKKLPKRLKILNWGENKTNDGSVFLNDETVDVFDANQLKTGRNKSVAIDFDHSTVKNSKEYVAGQPKSIAGYGDPELIKGDGLYLNNIDWTPMGEDNARNYKDLSPAALIKNNGTVLGLDSVALTPHGAVYDLNFYSADDMIKKMNTNKKEGLVFSADYNIDGANPSLTEKDGKYTVNTKPLSVVDKNDIKHAEDCFCVNCMDSDEGDSSADMMSADDHKSEYGNVSYADTMNHKYPIDTKEHVKAAWSYINMPKNAKEYDSEKLSLIKGKIKSAAVKFGIEIADDKDKTTKTMSANTPLPRVMPDAYQAIPQQYKTMNDTIIKEMASLTGLEGETDQAKVLFAFLAAFKGMQEEAKGLINSKVKADDGGLKQFSAQIENLTNEIKILKTEKSAERKRFESSERESLVDAAVKEGKLVPFSADTIKTMDINILKEALTNTPKNIVPLNRKMKTMNADSNVVVTQEQKVSKFLDGLGISKI